MEFLVSIPLLTDHPDGIPFYSLALKDFYERGVGDMPKPSIALPYEPVDGRKMVSSREKMQPVKDLSSYSRRSVRRQRRICPEIVTSERGISQSKTYHPTVEDLNADRDGFGLRLLPVKGRSVFTQKKFLKNEFLLMYPGELISKKEGNRREDVEETGFRFFFSWKEQNLCVDATEEPSPGQPSFGRLINHGTREEINAKVRVVEIMGKPRLCIFAIKDIPAHTELLYDYGVPSGFKFPPPYYNPESRVTTTEHIEDEWESNHCRKENDNLESCNSSKGFCEMENQHVREESSSISNNTKKGSDHFSETENNFAEQSDDISSENDSESNNCVIRGDMTSSAGKNQVQGKNGGRQQDTDQDLDSDSFARQLLTDIISGVCCASEDSDSAKEFNIRCMKVSTSGSIPIKSDSCNLVNISNYMSTIMAEDSIGDTGLTEGVSSKSAESGQVESNFGDVNTIYKESGVTGYNEEEKSSKGCEKQKQNVTLEATILTDTEDNGNHATEIVSESSFDDMSDVIPHRIDRTRCKEVEEISLKNRSEEILRGENEEESTIIQTVSEEIIQDDIGLERQLSNHHGQKGPSEDDSSYPEDHSSRSKLRENIKIKRIRKKLQHFKQKPSNKNYSPVRAQEEVSDPIDEASESTKQKHMLEERWMEENHMSEEDNTDLILEKHHYGKGKKASKHKKTTKHRKFTNMSEESSEDIDEMLNKHYHFKHKKGIKNSRTTKHKNCKIMSEESCGDENLSQENYQRKNKKDGEETLVEKHHCHQHRKTSRHSHKHRKATKHRKFAIEKKSMVISEESSEDEDTSEEQQSGKHKKATTHKKYTKKKNLADSSEESSEDERLLKSRHHCKSRRCTKRKKSAKFKKSANMSEGTCTSEEESSDGEVQTVSKKDGKRVWNRKDYCFFCDKEDLKIARHWFIWHKDEKLVKEIENLPKFSKPRTERIASLRNKGNLKHNLTVWQTGAGKIVPRKRPCYEEDASDYLPCEFCSGSFKREWLSLHQKKCGERHGRDRQRRVQSAAKMMIPENVSSGVSDALRAKVLTRMQSDETTADVKRDRDILVYGSRLLRSHPEEHHALLVSQKMRDLAKLVRAAQSKDPSISGIRQCIDPNKYDTVVAAVKTVSGYSEQTESYETPSYARNIGFELDKVIAQLGTEALKLSEDNILVQNVSRFKDIKLASWSHDITCVAHQTLQKRKRNRPNLLPLADDIKKLTHHLKGHMDIHEEELRKEPTSTKNWLELCQATLASVSLFNKRRSGETERLLLEDYKKGCNQDTDVPEEVFQSLSELEKVLLMKLQRIEVRGKRDRTVPILLTNDMVSKIDLLIETREAVGVNSKDNPYVFARPYFGSPFSAKVSECYQKFCKACGALQNPESIRSTKLRKHIAIMSQLLCLKDNELDLLAGYMGHDIRIHREFYRLPENTLQLAKVSKLLIMMERGITSDYKGKSLDQINIPLDESEGDDNGDDDDDHDDDETKGNISLDGEECNTLSEDREETCNADDREDSIASFEEKNISDYSGEDNPESSGRRKKRNYNRRRPWKPQEKTCVIKYFQDAINTGRNPNRTMCEMALQQNPVLKGRTWSQIKDFVVAERKRKLKRLLKKTD